MTCPECGNIMVHAGGCAYCPSCGYSCCNFTPGNSHGNKKKIQK